MAHVFCKTSKNSDGLLYVLVLIAAVVLRGVLVDTFPAGFSGHAFYHARLSLKFRDAIVALISSSSSQVPFPPIVQQCGLMGFFHGLIFSVFGQGIWQSRLLSQICGVGTVICAYHLGKLIGNRTLGIVLAASVACSPWCIAFSRNGDAEHALPVLQFWLVALVTARMLIVQSGFIFVSTAGVITAASWYLYATNQIIPPVLLGLLTIGAVKRRLSWFSYLTFWVAFLLCSTPALIPSWGAGYYYPFRSTLPDNANYQIGDIASITRNIGNALEQLFIASADEWYATGFGGFGLFGKALIVMGCLSLLFSLRRTGNGFFALPFVAVAFGLIPGLVGPEVYYRRLIVAASAILFLQGFGLWRIIERLSRNDFTYRRCLVSSVAVAFLLCDGGWLYFARTRQSESDGQEESTRLIVDVVKHFPGLKQRVVTYNLDGRYQLLDCFKFLTATELGPQDERLSIIPIPESNAVPGAKALCACTNNIERILVPAPLERVVACCDSHSTCHQVTGRDHGPIYYIIDCTESHEQ